MQSSLKAKNKNNNKNREQIKAMLGQKHDENDLKLDLDIIDTKFDKWYKEE